MSESLKVKKLESIGNSESLPEGRRRLMTKPSAGYLIPSTNLQSWTDSKSAGASEER